MFFLLYLYIIKKLKLNDILLFAFYQILSIVVIAGVIYNKSFNELIDGFIKILSYTAFEGRPTFFFGRYSNKGFLLYFPALVLFKTELPILLLFILSILKTFYDVFKNKSLNKDTMLTIGIFLYLVVASFSKMQIGHRHLLPIYLLIIFNVSKLIQLKYVRWFCYIMIFWNAIISFRAYPWYISYFNELIGGTKNGWEYFTDSNIDWGQGLKNLGFWVKENDFAKKGIYLSYFGTGDPEYYGITYKPVGFVSNLKYEERAGKNIVDNKIDRIILAISITNLQATYYKDKEVFSFLKKLKPIAICAASIFVYDLTENKDTLRKFVELLNNLGYNEDVNYITKNFL